MKQFAAMLLMTVLVACGGSDGSGSYESDVARVAPPPPPPPPATEFRQAATFDQEAPVPTEPTDPVASDTQYIAYSYSLGLSVPRPEVDRLMTKHMETCLSAGPRNCIVINSNLNNQDDDYASAWLSIRATPEWLEAFMPVVEDEADEAGGAVTNRSTSAEDLTRTILDTDARLNAQITLQGRLEELLQRRDGELSDLLAIEREYARVTGQIESIKSNLRALQLRVSMSELSLNYQTKRSLTEGGRSNPLMRAFGDFFYNLSAALGAVITAFAVGLPWMLLIGLMIFIWLRFIWPLIKRRRKTSEKTAS